MTTGEKRVGELVPVQWPDPEPRKARRERWREEGAYYWRAHYGSGASAFGNRAMRRTWPRSVARLFALRDAGRISRDDLVTALAELPSIPILTWDHRLAGEVAARRKELAEALAEADAP
jgi:hypothetical protein